MAESNQCQENMRTWVNAGIPKRFLGKELADLHGYENEIVKASKTIGDGLSLFITGSCGTGKTHLAVGLLKLWLSLNFKQRPIFLPSVEFFAELKANFDSNFAEREIIARYASAPLLVMDDVGSEKVSEWSRQQFFLLLDRRYRNMLPVVVTSNLTLDELAKHIDDRLASRLSEMGEIIMLNGPDRRVSDLSLRKPAPIVMHTPVGKFSEPIQDEEEKAQINKQMADLVDKLSMAKTPARIFKSATLDAGDRGLIVVKSPQQIEQENIRRQKLKAQAEKLN